VDFSLMGARREEFEGVARALSEEGGDRPRFDGARCFHKMDGTAAAMNSL
jgi:hypothetical protein